MKYWVHKVEELWKEVEDIKKRLDALETPIAKRLEIPAPAKEEAEPELKEVLSAPAPAPGFEHKQPASAPHEDPVISILKHHKEMNIIDLNSALKELGISESVRDTLFKRMKNFMDQGVVKFDEKKQTFFLS